MSVTEDLFRDTKQEELRAMELLKQSRFLKKIGVIGLSQGVGATFVATNLAYFLRKKGILPTVVSLGDDCFYEIIKNKANLLPNEKLEGQMIDGICWDVLQHWAGSFQKEKRKQGRDFKEQLKRIYGIKTATGIYDFSGAKQIEYFQDLAAEMDWWIVVMDAMPHVMEKGMEFLEELKESPMKKQYLVNQYTQGINKRELLDFYQIKKPIYIPEISRAEICKGEYKGIPSYCLEKVEKQIAGSMESLWKDATDAKKKDC